MSIALKNNKKVFDRCNWLYNQFSKLWKDKLNSKVYEQRCNYYVAVMTRINKENEQLRTDRRTP